MNEQDFLPFTRPSIDELTIAEVGEVLRSGWITTGPRCAALEAALSERFGGRPVRLVNSATAALELALRLCGIGPGDEVITTPLSWVATANVILAVGATPIFVDVDPLTRNIDLDAAEAAVTPRTAAIIPVDLAGLPVDRDRLQALAARHGLRVIEDAAQSFGASWRGREIGSTGDLVAFSFHANKNLTSGEGGCLVLRNQAEATAFERLRLQGVERFPDGTLEVKAWGGKANMTDIAAAIALGQLRSIDGFTARRRALARQYFERWNRGAGFELPPDDFDNSNWHMFQPLLPRATAARRGEFIGAMRAQGIGVGVHYPAMHLFGLFRGLGWQAGQFPVAEDIGARTVTLPLFPAMADADVARVCTAAARAVGCLR
ncbi:DegT/DnrJ/EryC1/StrS aminotransferase family protein [Xylophilus rhododendri]|uniref:DegT/DnrJ/EryC1/StrS aminotransferase family protein n=1 Tax=Xylophilus rhododendri TaxID=2697032 RepID=A0A857JB06_9BURK|nr:DegT/DnrJ/EryC1/StrS aminotransferase family protein [Xylophilus rhododendri]QHJ00332.1 DegT/DnrJ/EryC1/StrS aminotransferase family protein [Xylophilus rhododendri]